MNGAKVIVIDVVLVRPSTRLIGPEVFVSCGWISSETIVIISVNMKLISSFVYNGVLYNDVTVVINILLSIP